MGSQSGSRAPLLPQTSYMPTPISQALANLRVTCWSGCPSSPPGELIPTFQDPAQVVSSPVPYWTFIHHSHLHLLRCLFQDRNLDFCHIHSYLLIPQIHSTIKSQPSYPVGKPPCVLSVPHSRPLSCPSPGLPSPSPCICFPHSSQNEPFKTKS